jgi:hypothetical protein
MHPVAALVFENAYKHHSLFAPLLFSTFAAIANVSEPIQHALLIRAVAWALLWILAVFKAGIWSSSSAKRRKTTWLAGACLAFAQICDRAACDREGVWATKVYLGMIRYMDVH